MEAAVVVIAVILSSEEVEPQVRVEGMTGHSEAGEAELQPGGSLELHIVRFADKRKRAKGDVGKEDGVKTNEELKRAKQKGNEQGDSARDDGLRFTSSR